MTEATSIAVVSAGVVSALGLSWASTCAAVRAGLDGFRETAFVDEVGEPLLHRLQPRPVPWPALRRG